MIITKQKYEALNNRIAELELLLAKEKQYHEHDNMQKIEQIKSFKKRIGELNTIINDMRQRQKRWQRNYGKVIGKYTYKGN